MTSFVPGMREAYDESAAAWAAGPASAFEVMADILVAAAGTPLLGARVLDLGTGTGAYRRTQSFEARLASEAERSSAVAGSSCASAERTSSN